MDVFWWKMFFRNHTRFINHLHRIISFRVTNEVIALLIYINISKEGTVEIRVQEFLIFEGFFIHIDLDTLRYQLVISIIPPSSRLFLGNVQ